MRKLWLKVDRDQKEVATRVGTVEERVESSDFVVGQMQERIIDLEKEKVALKSDMVYMQSQSMRNNLIFTNINEDRIDGKEDCEEKIREFLISKMKLAETTVAEMRFERVHRMGAMTAGKVRRIVAKFHAFKDKELVRKNGRALQGTNFSVYEQYPNDVVEKRRRLLP